MILNRMAVLIYYPSQLSPNNYHCFPLPVTCTGIRSSFVPLHISPYFSLGDSALFRVPAYIPVLALRGLGVLRVPAYIPVLALRGLGVLRVPALGVLPGVERILLPPNSLFQGVKFVSFYFGSQPPGGFEPELNYSQPTVGGIKSELIRISIFSRVSAANPRASEPQASKVVGDFPTKVVGARTTKVVGDFPTIAHFGDESRRSWRTGRVFDLDSNRSRAAVNRVFSRSLCSQSCFTCQVVAAQGGVELELNCSRTAVNRAKMSSHLAHPRSSISNHRSPLVEAAHPRFRRDPDT